METTNDDARRYVVLVDLIGSRDIEDRQAFRSRLEDAMASVNVAEEDHLTTPLTQMKGIDEFGCVLTNLAPLPSIVNGLLNRIHPTQARFGVASGGIDVGTDSDTVAKMDGPAFHRASELLEALEREDLFARIDTGVPTDGLVSSALNLLILERMDLTDRQVEMIRAYERHGTQTAAGDELAVPQQAVSRALDRANYMRRQAIRAELRAALETVYD